MWKLGLARECLDSLGYKNYLMEFRQMLGIWKPVGEIDIISAAKDCGSAPTSISFIRSVSKQLEEEL